jgi:hypothetical protein
MAEDKDCPGWDPLSGGFRADERVKFLTHEELGVIFAHRGTRQ